MCETFDDNMIDVSFEQGENRQLKFVRDSQDKYRISALEWKNKEGKINYDTTFFYIAPGGERALLKVKLEDIYTEFPDFITSNINELKVLELTIEKEYCYINFDIYNLLVELKKQDK